VSLFFFALLVVADGCPVTNNIVALGIGDVTAKDLRRAASANGEYCSSW
jgi:hypothetical protein